MLLRDADGAFVVGERWRNMGGPLGPLSPRLARNSIWPVHRTQGHAGLARGHVGAHLGWLLWSGVAQTTHSLETCASLPRPHGPKYRCACALRALRRGVHVR